MPALRPQLCITANLSADLTGADTVSKTHIAGALSYRRLTHIV
jgi:predicted ATPase with chaperone activity